MAQIDVCRPHIEAAIGRSLTPREIGEIGRQAQKVKAKIDPVAHDHVASQQVLKAYLDQRELEREARKAASAASAAALAQKVARRQSIGAFADKNPAEAARGFFVSSEKDYSGAKDSLGINLDRAAATEMQGFISAAHKAGLGDYIFSRADEKNMWSARAALEEGRDPSQYGANAVKAATLIKKFQDRQLAKLREAGIAKGHIDNYTQAQIHDTYQLARAGENPFGSDASFQKWFSDTMPKVAWDKSFGGELVAASTADKAARMRSVWNQFVSGHHLEWSDSLKAIKSREIVFKDADAGYQYHKQYGGDRSFGENVWHQLGRGARTITTAQEWGPNAESNINRFLNDWEKEVSAKNDPAMSKKFGDMKDTIMRNYVPSYLGQLNGTARGATQWLTQLRGFLAAAKVGASLPTLFMDTGLRAAQMDRFGGRSTGAFFGGLAKSMGDQFHGLDPEARIARAHGAGILLQGAGLPVSEASREFSGPGVAGRMALSLMRHGGHNFWTDRMRINVATHEGFLHWQDRGSAFNQLSAGRQSLLRMFGISDKEWDVIRQQTPTDLPKGIKAFQPQNILDMDKSKFSSLAPAGASDRQLFNARDEVFRKYRNLVGEIADRSTVSPSSEMRAVLHAGTKAGTPLGEITRSFGELKGFLWNYMKNHLYGGIVGGDADPHNVGWGPAMYKMATGKADMGAYARMARLTATMVGLAYIKNTLQDVASGKTPENPVGGHWSDAMLRAFGGGALGPMSDLLTSQTYMSPDAKWPDYVGAFAGPTVETAGDMADAFLNMAKHGAKYATDEGYDSDRFFHDLGVDTSHIASGVYRSVPYNNLLWTKWATDYMFYDNLMDIMNPGYKDRMRARLQKERGQSLILDGGNAQP